MDMVYNCRIGNCSKVPGSHTFDSALGLCSIYFYACLAAQPILQVLRAAQKTNRFEIIACKICQLTSFQRKTILFAP